MKRTKSVFDQPGFSHSDLPLIQEFVNHGAEVIELAIFDPAQVTLSKVQEALAALGGALVSP